MPASAVPALCDAARQAGGVRLLLGWCPKPLDGFDPTAFADVRTQMAGYGLRRLVDAGAVHYMPIRLQTILKLLRGPLRPDVLVASLRRGPRGWTFTTEVAWMRAAVQAGAIIAGIERPGHPACDGGPPLPEEQIRLIGEDPAPPLPSVWAPPGDLHRAIGAHIARFVPEGARLQVGPGPLGAGILDSLEGSVRLDTGIVTDAILPLERRGRLIGLPIAPYMGGSEALYDWAADKAFLHGLEVTHDQGRLGSGPPLITVNTALEVDLDGQINVESVGGSAIAGIGGQPDYAFAGASGVSGGLSIFAVATRSGSASTLVETLSAPVSTPSHDVDVLVTETGAADLRTLDRRERRAAIAALWT
jgi:hypothetical protein